MYRVRDLLYRSNGLVSFLGTIVKNVEFFVDFSASDFVRKSCSSVLGQPLFHHLLPEIRLERLHLHVIFLNNS